MKNCKLLFASILMLCAITSFAQTGLNFQGVARNTAGAIIASKTISVKLSIIKSTSTGVVEYTETRNVLTNAYGVFTIVIGSTGAKSATGNFNTIDWTLKPKFIKIEMDPAGGKAFTTMGTQEFQYVAYARYSESVKAENISGTVPVTLGGTGVTTTAALKQSLQLQNVSNTTDSLKPLSNLMKASLSGKLNISDTQTMLNKRFARDTSSLSTRINAISATERIDFSKDIKVNGITVGRGRGNYSSNTVNGMNALYSNTTGFSNTAIGDSSLYFNTTGAYNTANGSYSLYSNTTGTSNTANGGKSLFTNTSGYINTAYGTYSLYSNTTGHRNSATGAQSLYSNTTGTNNTATGFSSLASNTIGNFNTANGSYSLWSNTTGTNNTAFGDSSLFFNTTGSNNVANGAYSLQKNTTGGNNTATGYQSLYSSNSGANTATGYQSLYSTTWGFSNTATGYRSLYSNTTGTDNTANGTNSLNSNTTGAYNTAIGNYSLLSNTTGGNNTATGFSSLRSNTTGYLNTANGFESLYSNTTGRGNIANGYNSLYSNITGTNNTAMGNNAGRKLVTGDKNIFIGNNAGNNNNFKTTSNKLVIQNDSSLTPLIYGEFDTKKLTFNGNLKVGDSSATTPSAVLEANSTTQGFLPPRMTTTQRDAISSPASGLVIFNTTTNSLEFKKSTDWVSLTSSSSAAVFLPTIVIGTQQWMKENLDVVTYRNGDIIPQVSDPTEWAGLTTGAWCYYNNDVDSGAIYSKLYNWYAVSDPRGLAPQGWHIPTDAEWTTLGTLLGGDAAAGGKMKTTGITRWNTPNTSATNESGYAGLPGGYRLDDGTFYFVGNYGGWWSATQGSSPNVAWNRALTDFDGTLFGSAMYKNNGCSVRCLRD